MKFDKLGLTQNKENAKEQMSSFSTEEKIRIISKGETFRFQGDEYLSIALVSAYNIDENLVNWLISKKNGAGLMCAIMNPQIPVKCLKKIADTYHDECYQQMARKILELRVLFEPTVRN